MSDLRRYFGEKWDADNGEELLLRTHDLNENSIVFDVGGYTGEWARAIVDKYDPNLYAFELVQGHCNAMLKKFRHNEKVRVFHYGLASADAIVPINMRGSATSTVTGYGPKVETCQLRRAWDAILDVLHAISLEDVSIDLMAINIEGGEYDLLPHLIETGLITRIRELVIQFHMLWPSSYSEWKKIRERLNVTHGEAWGYPFVWEKWVRR